MLTRQQVEMIRALRRRGYSIRKIAGMVECAANSVKKYLDEAVEPQYVLRKPRTKGIDPYREYIIGLLRQLGARKIPATVIWRGARAMGYEGGVSAVRALIAEYNAESKMPGKVIETEPGVEAQIDFTHFRSPAGTIYAFVFVLSYSRYALVRFYRKESRANWVSGLKWALKNIGGVPSRIIIDNSPHLVEKYTIEGEVRYQLGFCMQELAVKYRFMPILCSRARPQQKGKVERFIRFLKEDFLIPLSLQYEDMIVPMSADSVNADVGAWLEFVNRREHGVTKVSPNERLATERPLFLPLPPDA